MESKFDWLTLVIKSYGPQHDFNECFSVLCDDLKLGDLVKLMVSRRHIPFYDYSLTYEDIILSYTDYERFLNQGISISFSSSGLDFFSRYLDTYGLTLREWLGEFRALSLHGWDTRVTRLDYAMDDIRYNGDLPDLTIRRVTMSIKNNEFNTLAFKIDNKSKGTLEVGEDISLSKSCSPVGRTIYIGRRSSDTLIRFYDKLAEQQQKNATIPEGLTSWTRCEFELKRGNAMAVINAFIDLTPEQFSVFMCGFVNRHISFINRDNKNISRCSVKRWWTSFLNGCKHKFKLPKRVPARSAYARARRGLSQYVPTIYTIIQTVGFDGLFQIFNDEFEKKKEKCIDIFRPELAQNIIDCVSDYEEMTGFKRYQYTSFDDGSNFDIGEQMHKSHLRYVSRIYDYTHDLYRQQQHIQFCEGAEIL